MYASVHMPYIIPITELRKDIFTLTERVARTGDAIDVEKEGRRIVRIVPVRDDASGRADYILTHVLPKLKGTWKATRTWVRGAREKRYWKRPVFS